jgi:serine/threonine-protein kinase
VIEPGTLLGERYRVLRLLGEGAMGAVYEAEHTGIGKRLAVKVLHDRYAGSPQAVARFEREARAAAAIGHENIVDVMDFGMHEGVPFIAMELLKGETVDERLSAVTAFDARTACRIAAQMLSALASAHAAGIVHRDLKPANVLLVERSGTREFVKVLDFGISKFRRPDSVERVTTQDGMMLGTPAYMAPEQWMGRRDIDHRADLFAVGVMLYEMLTGGLPYEGETQGELFLEVVKSETEPPPPSEIAPTAPSSLDAIALRAVRRGVGERFQTAQEFVDALRPHGAGEITVTHLPPAAVALDESPAPTASAPRRARANVSTQLDSTHAPMPLVTRRRPVARLVIASVIALLGASGAVVFAKGREAHSQPPARPPATASTSSQPALASPQPPPTTAMLPVSRALEIAPVAPVSAPPAAVAPIATHSPPSARSRRAVVVPPTQPARVTQAAVTQASNQPAPPPPSAPTRPQTSHAGVGQMEVTDQF